MISKISGISLEGRCFSSRSEFHFFAVSPPKTGSLDIRLGIVFGRNGCGKSTIADGFRQLCKPALVGKLNSKLIDVNGNQILVTKDSPIYVFDEKYIDENIKIAEQDGLNAVVLFGEQVELDSEIGILEAKKKEIDRKMQTISRDLEQFEDTNNTVSPEYFLKEIQKELKKDGGWADRDCQIKGNKRKSAVKEDTIFEIASMKTSHTEVEISEEMLKNEKILEKLSSTVLQVPKQIDPIYFQPDIDMFLNGLLTEKIERPTLTDRETAILTMIESGQQSLVEFAQEVFSRDETKLCPLCLQAVSSSYKDNLLHMIDGVLNKASETLRQKLRDFAFPDITLELTQYEVVNEKYVIDIMLQTEKCKKIIEQYTERITARCNNIFAEQDIVAYDLQRELEELNKLILSLEAERAEIEKYVTKKDALKKQLIELNKLLAHLIIVNDFRAYQKQLGLLEDKKKKYIVCGEEIRLIQEQIDNLQNKKADVKIAVEIINSALKYIFFSETRLTVEVHNKIYYLKSNGKEVKPKDISCGERNILALTYFFSQIMQGKLANSMYKREMLLVIDDPVSSFDFENRVGIMSYLSNQIEKVLLGHASSKLLFLSHDLATIFNLQTIGNSTSEYAKANNFHKISISTMEFANCTLKDIGKKYNEYSALVCRVYKFADGDLQDSYLEIGNIMRRFLEAFTTFNYRSGIDVFSKDINILSQMGIKSEYFKNLMFRLVLNTESHSEDRIKTINSENNFFACISEVEKQRTAKELLCLVYSLSPLHLMAHLNQGNFSGADEKIQGWMAHIPDNSSVKI